MKVLICDDNIHIRKMLEKITSEVDSISKILLAGDGLEAICMAQNEEFDIVLLDIEIPKLNGIEVAKIISKMFSKTKFIFITAHIEYVIDSFCVHPYSYLLKPIDTNKLKEVLEDLISIILKQYNFKNFILSKLAIKEKNKIHYVSIDDILYLEKFNREVLVYTLRKTYKLNHTLEHLEKNILNNTFIRTHQSFIVNKLKIQKIKLVGNRSYEIKFDGTENKAILSRYRYKEVIESLSNHSIYL